MSGGKAFGIVVHRKEILSGDLYKIVDGNISPQQKAHGVKTMPGEDASDTFRVGKGHIFNKKTYVYVDNIGFFPEVWITSPEGEKVGMNIVHELQERGNKPRLHRGLPEVLE